MMNTENTYKARVNALLESMAPVPERERYALLIEKGRSLTSRGEDTPDACFIRTCHSRTWLQAEFHGDRLRLEAGSDSLIVRGIIALLTDLLNGLSAEEAAEADPDDLASLNLEQYLKNSRNNIFRHIFSRVTNLARENTPGPVNPPSSPMNS